MLLLRPQGLRLPPPPLRPLPTPCQHCILSGARDPQMRGFSSQASEILEAAKKTSSDPMGWLEGHRKGPLFEASLPPAQREEGCGGEAGAANPQPGRLGEGTGARVGVGDRGDSDGAGTPPFSLHPPPAHMPSPPPPGRPTVQRLPRRRTLISRPPPGGWEGICSLGPVPYILLQTRPAPHLLQPPSSGAAACFPGAAHTSPAPWEPPGPEERDLSLDSGWGHFPPLVPLPAVRCPALGSCAILVPVLGRSGCLRTHAARGQRALHAAQGGRSAGLPITPLAPKAPRLVGQPARWEGCRDGGPCHPRAHAPANGSGLGESRKVLPGASAPLTPSPAEP